ncbi:phage tail spike protein [Mammaliicoccus sciuri]|uniref:phage tail spike protein n=1 Tax=Mammaliicoccus sciuri TaxID=1296 RepID=UPI00374E1C98
MIHVLNFEGQIIDFISQSDSAIIRAEHNRNINEKTETFDFTILSDRTEHLQEKNRIIIEDSNRQYREFIIEHISQDIDGYTEIESTATYLEDLANAKPYAPNTLSKMTTKQALSDVLKDTGWKVSDQTEYGGTRTTSWTSYQTRYEVLLQLCTTYDMVADYYIELGNNTVEGRYVILRERNPMFNGKEITYGKDLIGLKRTVDFSEVKTALLCVGPEKEDGSRIELVVTDDEAQAEFGLPGRYSWGIYEPESDDQNMTEARLRTLGTTELNKRKSELISYEVTSTDISKVYKHEVTHLGDMVRIKNRDFTPPLYVEAEVISEQYDMIAEESTYGFGQYKEYRESDLRGEFDKKLSDIRQKMNDNFSNVNTIIQETISGELEYYEKKIIKSDTPPENPVDDMLWYDTSNPDVAVLWRYFNGEWREHSVNDVEKIGGITREKAMFSELSNTFINLTIQHSRLLSDVYEVINSEYFVDMALKNEVNSNLNDTIGVFDQIKTNLDSMKPETATIGKLIDTQLLFLTYRERMQALYKAVERAKITIDERFKLLQAQYTDEKFSEAMQKVADKFGFELTDEGFKTGEGSLLSGVIQAIKEDTEEAFKSVVKKVDYEADQDNIVKRMDTADSERTQLENQIADRVTKSEYENDVEQRLSTSKAETLIEAEQTSNRVSKEIYNESSQTLNRVVSEFLNNTTSGLTLSYDENGNIQTHTVGPDGIKMKGDRIDIQANKAFNVLVQDTNNKVGKNEIINRINLSPEGLDINVNNVGIRGGDSTSYVSIKNDLIELSGKFTRTWRGETQNDFVFARFKNGLLRFRNNTRERSLYYSDFGISTFVDGESSESSGTLQFFDYTYSTARGVTLNSANGVVALSSSNNRVILDANMTVNIESETSSVYFRPMRNSRIGRNEFRMWVKDNDTASDTDGVLTYGSLTSGSTYGSGIRFDKSSKTNFVYATNNNGDIGSGDFYARNLYGDWATKNDNLYAMVNSTLRVTDLKGYNNGNPDYKDLQCRDIQANTIRVNTGNNLYLGTSTGEVRVTNNLLYNGGSIGYKPIRAKDFIKASSAKFKKDIKIWNYDALSVIVDELQLYSYKYLDDERGLIQHGPVIGDLYDTPTEFIFGDGINTNEMLSWALRAIQQLNEKVKILEGNTNG